nr:hypothetical protein [Tanacetum cinerariifolium]
MYGAKTHPSPSFAAADHRKQTPLVNEHEPNTPAVYGNHGGVDGHGGVVWQRSGGGCHEVSDVGVAAGGWWRWRLLCRQRRLGDERRWWCCYGGSGGGGGGCGVKWRRVRESDIEDRIDRRVENNFGFTKKSPPEKFSGGGAVVAGGSGGLRSAGGEKIIVLTSDSSYDKKCVSREGPSIKSIPNERPSIAGRSKEPIPKEFLKWFGYDTVNDYLLVAKKPIPKKFQMRTLKDVQTSQRGKERFDVEGDETIASFCLISCSSHLKNSIMNHLVEIQADDHDLLVNSENENDDMLGYESNKYSDDEAADGTNHAEDADGTNHSDLKLVKRGITRLYKFRKEYAKPIGIKIKQYFDVDLTVKKLVMHRIGKLFENKEIKAEEEPPRSIMWLKGKKEADDKIKEGTLNLDDGTDAMTVVFDNEKGGYARGVGSEVTYKRVRLSDPFRFHRYCEEIELISVCFVDDLFIFARRDIESSRVIMDALEEFKLTSGLVPSIPKSMAYFCNVLPHTKNVILNIMLFSKGELPVKYLKVPLILSCLLNKNCKVLIEKAKNGIGD